MPLALCRSPTRIHSSRGILSRRRRCANRLGLKLCWRWLQHGGMCRRRRLGYGRTGTSDGSGWCTSNRKLAITLSKGTHTGRASGD